MYTHYTYNLNNSVRRNGARLAGVDSGTGPAELLLFYL